MPRFETVTGVTINYEEQGEGRPLVLVHGWSTSSLYWRFQRELAGVCRVIALDLRGHGSSSAPPCGYGLDDLTNDLVELFIELDLKDAILAGWSLGSQVVLNAIPQLPARLSGLILAGSTPRFTVADDWPHGLPTKEPRGMAAGLKRDYNNTMGRFFRSMFAEGELSREQENRIAREILIPARRPAPEAAIATLDILSTTDLRSGLHAIEIPTLVIHGSADTISLPGAARFVADQIPAATLHMIEGVGHAPFLSIPDMFNEIVMEFIREFYGSD
jgi:pimeloyl-[acyl-carrier protein] methyl ester esterase